MAIDDLNIILDQALQYLKNLGKITVSENEVVQVGNYKLSQIYIGNQPLINDTFIVDQITKNFNCLASFMYIAPVGLIRISTNLKDSRGNPLIGTLIDNNHPICISIKKGIKEMGRSWIINDFYNTTDLPILDESGKAIIAFGLGRREITGEREIILFKLGEHTYGFNIMFINEVINFPEYVINTTTDNKYIFGVFSIKDEIIPLINTYKLFGFNFGNKLKNCESKKVIIIQFETKKFGFIIDKVHGLAKYDLKETEKFQILGMDSLSREMIDGVLPNINNFENVILLLADKLVQIVSNNT